LQTSLWHADLRLPCRRPDFSVSRELAECSPAQQRWLATQQGFCGVTEVRDDICQWHRYGDFHAPAGCRDIGRMLFHRDGNTVEEYGIEADYHETWQRLPESVGPTAAWISAATALSRLLLVAGDCFFLVRPRKRPLPRGRSLAATLQDGPDCLDFELSFGRIRGAGSAWRILHSTLPWREGASVEGGDWRCLDGHASDATLPGTR
jgi:hypothetical protein